MVRRSLELLVVLIVLFGGLHWWSEHKPEKHELAANLQPLVIPPVRPLPELGAPPPPLDEPPPKPAKKRFWQKSQPAETEELRLEEETRPVSPTRRSWSLELPDAHFTGVKLFLWASACPRGELAVRDCELYCRTHRGFTIGDGPQFHIWVIRVPPESEPTCPRFEFYCDGRPLPPPMFDYCGKKQLPFIFARIPGIDPHFGHWNMSEAREPRSSPAAAYSPLIGIRYKSDTDVGVGIGGCP